MLLLDASPHLHCRSGPNRVTPEGGRAVEGPTATAAWAALFGGAAPTGKGAAKDAAAAAARAAGRSGPLAFGLQHPRVRALLQQLPGAARLENLLAWEGGDRPDVPPLVRARGSGGGGGRSDCTRILLGLIFKVPS